MTTLPNKTTLGTPGLNKQASRTGLNIFMVILMTATILPLPGGAHGIHWVAGLFLLIACGVHLMRHERWIKAVILNTPKVITSTLRRQRRLFWIELLSGSLCGLSGLISLLSIHIFLPVICLVTPMHILSGLTFLGSIIYHMVLHRSWFATKIGRVSVSARR